MKLRAPQALGRQTGSYPPGRVTRYARICAVSAWSTIQKLAAKCIDSFASMVIAQGPTPLDQKAEPEM
jgi:hypothetical protein